MTGVQTCALPISAAAPRPTGKRAAPPAEARTSHLPVGRAGRVGCRRSRGGSAGSPGGRPRSGRHHPAPPRTVPSSPHGRGPPTAAGSARPWQGCCPNGPGPARTRRASAPAVRRACPEPGAGGATGAGGPGRVRPRQRFVPERRRAARRALGSGRALPSGRHSSPSGSEAASARARLQSASWYLRLGIATKFRASSRSIRCCGVGLNRCSLSSPSKK